MGKAIVVSISLLIVVSLGLFLISNMSKNSTSSKAKESSQLQSTSSDQVQSVDKQSFSTNKQASFAIFTNGTFRNFTASMYHNLSNDVFIQKNNPNIVHVKKAGITWSDFFKTLPFSLTKDCLTTGTKEKFCSGVQGTLKFYLNGVRNEDSLSQEIEVGDKLLVTYGTESEGIIKQQLNKIP